jgi:alpha-galactosidase
MLTTKRPLRRLLTPLAALALTLPAALVTATPAAASLAASPAVAHPPAAHPPAARPAVGTTPAAAGPAAAAAPAPLLEDGLALTPPMGFNNWNSTHCRAEFNEAMVKGIADLFVTEGLKDAGYQYVNLDDCWALPERGADGNLVPDPVRFPNGIKAVADYVHAKGLRFGIYTSAGTKTCNRAGFPGGLDHEQQDANLFASWGVDYLKYDNCNNQGRDAIERYTKMRDALKATGRPIVYSICEWGQNKPWLWAQQVGHLWRTTGDISDNWGSLKGIIQRNLPLAQYARPGAWNDPDMLEVGNGGMTDLEYRTHFSMWAIMAAPLLIGSDLRKATPATLEILGNREVIAVDQDRLGVQGQVIAQQNGRYVVVKRLQNGDRAIALYNETDRAATISTTAAAAGLPQAPAYRVRDLWTKTTRETAGVISATVPPHGTVLVRAGTDRRWPLYPPAVELTVATEGELALVEPGTAAVLTTVGTNHGRLPAALSYVDFTAPAGWAVTATSRSSTPVLLPNRPLRTTWSVTPPADAKPGSYELTGRITYYPGQGARPSATPAAITVVVPPPAPIGTVFLSDVPFLTASNFYGPVERDRSNGERPGGDGKPITIRGTVYAKGLGVHAPSDVEYYAGKKCSSVRAVVGVDDETNGRGSVGFEIYADGRKVTESGQLTGVSPAFSITAEVTGATVVKLVVTDGGDGQNYDHADWADLMITC